MFDIVFTKRINLTMIYSGKNYSTMKYPWPWIFISWYQIIVHLFLCFLEKTNHSFFFIRESNYIVSRQQHKALQKNCIRIF